ncbi:MAG: VWA domain-containing protein [Oligosphaeraceae bacterium]
MSSPAREKNLTRAQGFALTACLLSLALHLLLFQLAARLPLSGTVADSLRDKQRSPRDYAKIRLQPPPQEPAPVPEGWLDASEMEIPEFQNLAGEPEDLLPSLQEQSDKVRSILDDYALKEPPVELFQLQPAPLAPADLPAAPQAIAFPLEGLQVTAPSPEILAVSEEDLAPERLEDSRRPFLPDWDREFVPPDVALPSLANPGALAGPPPAAVASQLSLQSMRPSFSLSDQELEALLGAEGAVAAQAAPLQGDLPGLDAGGALSTSVGAVAGELPLPLDEYVSVQVYTYPDPAGSGGTFLVEIRPGPKSESLDDIPKDVLFLLDRSSSISLPKFQQFRKSVLEVLPALSPRDRFNVVAFNDRQSAVFREYVPASRENLATAAEKLRQLPHGGRTDVFGGVAPFVRQANGDLRRPLNIFLLTDGQSTVNIYEPSLFLRQISGINPGNVSIFPFSAERKANRMLLDFLGYLNRGEKCHVETTEEIRDAMVRFYSQHASLIITALRCAATSGADVNEIFPRSLPNLYRDQTLRLFGRYRSLEDNLVLSLTGRDAQGKPRDLLFRRPLAQCPRGQDTLPAQWAAQKILFLLSRMNLSENPAEQESLRERIETLKKQYGILSPY